MKTIRSLAVITVAAAVAALAVPSFHREAPPITPGEHFSLSVNGAGRDYFFPFLASADAAMTDDAKNYMLDQRFGTGATSGTYISLHSADPTTTVATALANEIAGGSPAYARKQLNLNAAATGAKTLAASAVFDIQAGDAFSYYALWTVATSGTQAQFHGSAALTAAEGAYGSQGTYTITALSLSL